MSDLLLAAVIGRESGSRPSRRLRRTGRIHADHGAGQGSVNRDGGPLLDLAIQAQRTETCVRPFPLLDDETGD